MRPHASTFTCHCCAYGFFRSVWNQSPSLLNQLVTHARKPKSYGNKLKPTRLSKLRRRIGSHGDSTSTTTSTSREGTYSPRSFLNEPSIQELDEHGQPIEEREGLEETDEDGEGEGEGRQSSAAGGGLLELEGLRASPEPMEDEDGGEDGGDGDERESELRRRPRTKSEADVRSLMSMNSMAEKRRSFFGLSARSTSSLHSGASGGQLPKKKVRRQTCYFMCTFRRESNSETWKKKKQHRKWFGGRRSTAEPEPGLPPIPPEHRKTSGPQPQRGASSSSSPVVFPSIRQQSQSSSNGGLSDEVRRQCAFSSTNAICH
jgi:hypothetical protein